MRRFRIATMAAACGVMLFLGSQLAGQNPAGPARSSAPVASGPSSGPTSRAAYPLWDGKETVAAYARRARIKQTDVTLDLGKGMSLRATLIPAGKFLMGATKEEFAAIPTGRKEGAPRDEQQHEVTITRPFYMGVFSVTQEQFTQVMGKNPSTTKNPKNPVETVPWPDAVDFAKKVSEKSGKTVRLATEAEWEFACRAGTTTPFNTGQTISVDQANYDGSAAPFGKGVTGVYRGKILPVGTFKSNAWGLYDMHGNCGQWVADWYDKDYYASSPAVDPRGPQTGTKRVYRGGGYGFSPSIIRSASRAWEEPTRAPAWLAWIGFRIVVELPGEK